VNVNYGAGRAELKMTNLSCFDYGNIPNALFRNGPPAIDAKVSFDITWDGPISQRGPITGPPGSKGQNLLNASTMTWSASNATGFKFVSNPSGTTSHFAQLAQVKNGVFVN
jgi:hypothetical protein